MGESVRSATNTYVHRGIVTADVAIVNTGYIERRQHRVSRRLNPELLT